MSTPYQPPLVLGLTGTRGVGKDTLARHLIDVRPAYERWAFADALKDDLRPFIMEHFDFDSADCTPAQKELIRPLLISYGCAQRAVDINHWVDIVIRDIRSYAPAVWFDKNALPIPVITDVRFESEAVRLREEFGPAFKLLNLTRVGAPPPTDEEEKHFRQVAAMADWHVGWGCEDEKEQRERAQEVDEWVKGVLRQ